MVPLTLDTVPCRLESQRAIAMPAVMKFKKGLAQRLLSKSSSPRDGGPSSRTCAPWPAQRALLTPWAMLSLRY